MPLCGLEALVAEYMLDFLHHEASLVQQRATGVAGQVPVDMFLDSCSHCHLADQLVAMAVVTDIGKGLDGWVSLDDIEGLAAEDVRYRYLHDVVGLQLIDSQHAVPELGAPE